MTGIVARHRAGLMLALLAGCTLGPPKLAQVEVFRDPSAQIASQTDVTADRMAGEWYIRQRFTSETGPVFRMSLGALSDGDLELTDLIGDCIDDVCNEEEVFVLLKPSGPGRWTPTGPQALLPDAELWVMWMDFDSRTAAIGTPSGEFGWIMDKNPTGGGDRITAARDIMDWFGYDVGRLEGVR